MMWRSGIERLKAGACLQAILVPIIACKQAPAFRAAVCAGSLAIANAVGAEVVVVDFERAEVGKRLTEWTEQGVVFKLAHAPKQTKAAGRMVFFPHLESGHKGLLNAMAMEPIAVQARLPRAASAVTLVLWGSTGCAAKVEAFDAEGKLVDEAEVAEVPQRKAPGEPVPFFELTVRAPKIAVVRWSGPRAGEFLAADEVRFTPAE